MAGPTTKGDLSSERLSSEFLQCPLCYDRFTSPKVLPCQHTFCLTCLRRYVGTRGMDNIIPCPMCKDLSEIPGNDVANYKSNFLVVSLLDFVKATSMEAEAAPPAQPVASGSLVKKCGACEESGDLANFCQSCQLWLCVRCSKAHARVPSTAGHNLLTNEEVDRQCKDMMVAGERAICELQRRVASRQDMLCAQMEELPENVDQLKRKIEAAAQEATAVISDKEKELLARVDQFLHDQANNLSHRLEDVLERRRVLDHLLEMINDVKNSDDGHKNQTTIKSVEDVLSKGTLQLCDVNVESLGAGLSFNNFVPDIVRELRTVELGCLHSVHCKPSHLLHDRPLRVHKVFSLARSEYISGLVINKVADKIVIANNDYVTIVRPDSASPMPFLSPLSERKLNRPWNVAYCEDDRRVFITEAGMYEGQGSVISYSLEGKFHSVVASGLTLPRGLAVYKKFIFVCDQIDRCVYVLNSWGRITRVLKKTPDGKCLFNAPMFVSVGKTGRLAVSDSCTYVKIFDKDCSLLYTYTSHFSDSEFWDVLVLQDDTVIVCDWKHGLHSISPQFTANGLVRLEDTEHSLREPSALAALENGKSLYVGTFGGDVFSLI